MSETKLTAADYELRGYSPAQAAFAAGMRFAEPAPEVDARSALADAISDDLAAVHQDWRSALASKGNSAA
jgi:hypothetical protein